ncbi:hypothetical protein CcI49_29980 [Frankia sp. CcI49]|uniref:hypothetical protein n=1 Tax=Frankia sp. CcI49 TaxID=1745382 RepID=UPI000977B0CC|nr:hypothetical protein [Frankia sp. CcI49]ONH54597.1 hypothetical protein CcI49_29980 [Frankia sp. CcI49]
MGIRGAVCALAAIAAIAAGCGGADEVETRAIHGTFTFPATTNLVGVRSCDGSGGYSDIHRGAQATLTDAEGTIVSTTRIGNGTHGGSAHCTFPFTFLPIEVESGFYSVEISRRGKITKSVAELDADEWTFELSLGL